MTRTVRCRLPNTEEFRTIDLDAGNDPDVEALQRHLLASLQVQHLAVLAGCGTSMEAQGPSMDELWTRAAGLPKFAKVTKAVEFSDGDRDIEALLSRCEAFLELRPKDRLVEAFRTEAIDLILKACRALGTDETSLTAHKEFLRRLARRRARDARLRLFTTNYDLCFDRAANQLTLVPIDGFSFAQPRHFDPKFLEYDVVRYNRGSDGPALIPGVFLYYKLHGSVDWTLRDGRIEMDSSVDAQNVQIIYPARGKFQRSYQQPHLELMAHYLSSLREPNTCLVCVGFGFRDDHLSAPILSALESNPHFRLIVVCPSVEDDLAGSSANWKRLATLAGRSDVAFLATTFGAFARLIPDLRALTPPEDLARAVRRIARGGKG